MPKSPPGGSHRVEVRNSTRETSRKKRRVSSKRTTTIPKVVKMERYAQAVSRIFITRSLASLERLFRFQGSVVGRVPPASTDTDYPPKPSDHRHGAGTMSGSHMLQADPSRHKRLLRLLERRFQVAALRLALRVEHGAGGAVLVLGPRLLRQAARQRHVPRGLHDPVEVLLGQVEVHEGLHRVVVLERLGAHVDEQRAREQVIAGADGLLGGLDAVHGEHFERVLVDRVVGVTEVAERVRVARDALHEHVVVLARLVVRAVDLLLVTHNDLVEELVGAGLGAGTVETQLPGWPLGTHLVPLRDLSLGGRLPHRLELLACYVGRPVVLGVDHDRDAVEGHRDLYELDSVLLAHRHLLGHVYGPGSVGDLGVALAERLEAVAGAGAADLDARVRVLLQEQLRRRLGDRLHRAGALDADIAGYGFAATASAAFT